MADLLLWSKLAALWLAVLFAASLLQALAYPVFNRGIRGCDAAVRSVSRLAYGLMAPLAATLVTVLITQPALSQFLLPAHCHAGHCGAHRPAFSVNSPLGTGLLLAAGLAALALPGALAWAVRSGQRRLRVLRILAQPAGERPYRVVDAPGQLACCVGLWRPEVLLSRGLLEVLEPGQFEAVLAHERAHADRLDNLRRLLLYWSTLLWPSPLQRRIRSDAAADTEQACDLHAARELGDPTLVAGAIRSLESSQPQTGRARAAAFGSGDSAPRLVALERQGASGRVGNDLRLALLWLGLNWCILAYALTVLSHLSIEWLAAGI